MADPNEQALYTRLSRYVMPVAQLEPYSYPYRDPENPELCMAVKDRRRLTLRENFKSSYSCERCKKVYLVGRDGVQLPSEGACIHHSGKMKRQGGRDQHYWCCQLKPGAPGCASNPYHVHEGESELERYRGFVETQPKPERDPNRHGIYALDCEMCFTVYGLELARVTVVNYKEQVVYERLVKPGHRILDYNTKTSGITASDLEGVTTTLGHVQRDLLNMFSDKTILIGHSLNHDMKALKMFHKCFIDTAQLFPDRRGLPFKRGLVALCREYLQLSIQSGDGHDSKEDAVATLRLVMWKANSEL